MQSAVISTAILSILLSQAGIVPRRMKIGSCGFHCEVAKHSSFLVGGDVRFHLKFALKVTHPLQKTLTSTNIPPYDLAKKCSYGE